MIEHYNAFISYKHAPEDNRIAEAVHRGLERFHIPRKIRKKTGVKRINRIFRDKDELPITSDLSDSISNALADADYLIVICSVNTKESAWVPREIEYFLKNHSKKDIFTVLVNGEPYDVIPDILKYEETVVTDEDGKERTVKVPTEPLSCDFRMPLSKARKTELPRLACGIIGCAYDELMNRRRQYRIKQLMAVFALVIAIMAAFSGYMYYSRNIIHENYLESLKNQSRYLANESGNLLGKEQRITALQLAVEALPKSPEDDRPVTAEAVKALTDATLAYEAYNGKNINAAWNYQMPGLVRDFRLSPDGKKLAIRDEGNVIGAWNTEDHKRVLYIDDLDSNVIGMQFINDTALAVWDNDVLTCYDTSNGELLWERPSGEDVYKTQDNLLISDGALYICVNDYDFVKIGAASGDVQNRYTLSDADGHDSFGIVECKLSPDRKKILFRGVEGWNQYAYGILDLDTNTSHMAGIGEETIRDIGWIGNDSFVISSTVVDSSGSMTVGESEIISSDSSTIRCYNAADLSEKWTSEFVCNGVMLESGFVNLGKDSVAYYSGNVITVFDVATGEMKYSNNVNDSVIDVSDRDGDGSPVYITENGGYAIPAPSVDADAVYYNKYFTDDVRKVVINNGVYVRQRYGHEVIYYGVNVYDDEWKQLCEDPSIKGSEMDHYIDEDYLVLLTSDENSKPAVEVFGLDEKAVHFRLDLDGEKVFAYKLLGVHKDHVYLGYDDSDYYDLVSIDINDKAVKTEQFFKTFTSFESALSMKDGKLIYIYKTDDVKAGLAIYDIDTGDKKELPLPEEVGFIRKPPVYYGENGIVCIEGEGDFVVDVNSALTAGVETPEGWTDAVCYSDGCLNGMYAISDGKKILLSGADGKVTSIIRCPGLTPLGMTFIDDELAVFYSDGSLFRYLADSGEFTKKSDVSVYVGYKDSACFDYDRDNKLLYIRMKTMTDVVDMESGVETTHVMNCFGHHMGRDIFITTSKAPGEDPKVGFYRRYSVGELLDKAHDILKGEELPNDMKSRYGID